MIADGRGAAASTTGGPRSPTSADFAALEVLRGLAAFYVVLNHSRGWLWIGGRAAGVSIGAVVNQVTRLGHEAVILFFVLSGFSIAHSVQRSRSVVTFWERRLLRLYPPMVAALAWAVAAFVFARFIAPDFFSGQIDARPFNGLAHSDFLSPRSLLCDLLYMPTGAVIPQFWSLPYEMAFYLMAPLLVRRPLAFVATSLGGWLVWLVWSPQEFWAQYFLHYMAFFAIGVLAYTYFDELRTWALRIRRPWLFVAGAMAVMVALSTRREDTLAGEIIASSVALVAIPHVIDAGRPHPVLEWLGRQSYTLYLTHVATILIVLAVIHRLGVAVPIRSPWIWPVALPPVLGASTLLYLAVEHRTRVVLDRRRKT